MPQVQIIESRKFMSLIPARRGLSDWLVVFALDGRREQTHSVVINADPVTDADLQRAVQGYLADRAKVVGKTFTV